MNPVTKLLDKGRVVFGLTKDDLKIIRKVKLKGGPGNRAEEDAHHEMCIMQLVSLVSTQERDAGQPGNSLVDHPICVSEILTDYMIEINDNCTDKQRARLKSVIPDVLNTCPVRQFKNGNQIRVRSDAEYKAAEQARERLLAERAPLLVENERSPLYGCYDECISMKRRIEAIREAAALFRADAILPD